MTPEQLKEISDNFIPWIVNAPGNVWHSMGPGGEIATFNTNDWAEKAVSEHNQIPLLLRHIAFLENQLEKAIELRNAFFLGDQQGQEDLEKLGEELDKTKKELNEFREGGNQLRWHNCRDGKIKRYPQVLCSRCIGPPDDSATFDPVPEFERLRAVEKSVEPLRDAMGELLEFLRVNAPGTPLNNHKFDALGLKCRNAYTASIKGTT